MNISLNFSSFFSLFMALYKVKILICLKAYSPAMNPKFLNIVVAICLKFKSLILLFIKFLSNFIYINFSMKKKIVLAQQLLFFVFFLR